MKQGVAPHDFTLQFTPYFHGANQYNTNVWLLRSTVWKVNMEEREHAQIVGIRQLIRN